MSLNRQRPRTRVNNRANTLPSLSNTTVNTDTTNTTSDTSTAFLPSIEESLQDWLSRSIPDTSSSSASGLLDVCRCCNQSDCESLETVSSTIRKLESDARLAAVIGQSLLQKHEQYVNESNEIKMELDQELDILRDRVSELEQSLVESDHLKQKYLQEKNRSVWEWQKTQKTLDEATSDLDIANNRCSQLGAELRSKINEVEKLGILKFMARQADIREDTLRAKLEDIKQELAVSRKAELTLESKHKKLKTKYESICFAYEKLHTDQQEMGLTRERQLDLVWLRESNEKLRKDVLKLTSALLSPNAAAEMQMNNNQNHLIDLIKELASANSKLKTDLIDCTDLLMECRNDLYAKLDQQEEIMQHDQGRTITKKSSLSNSTFPQQTIDSWLSTLAPQSSEESTAVPRLRRTESKRSNQIQDKEVDESSKNKKHIAPKTPSPQPSSSLPSTSPIVHHHYHYYVRNKLMAEKGKLNNRKPSNDSAEKIAIASSSEKNIKIDSSSPFRQLYNQVTMILQRLQQTDIRALNRRLRRAFDILELSNMSNSIIESIVTDVEGLKTRFLWIEDKSTVKQENWVQDISIIEFFPIVGLVQTMLKEIGQLRATMNDLQLEYVKKVEEIDIRLGEEVLRKQQQQQQLLELQNNSKNNSQSNTNQNKTSSALTWLSNVFQRSIPKDNNKSVKPVQSQDSLYARFIATNTSDISIYSTSMIHPLSKPKMIPSNSSTTVTVESNATIMAIRRKKSDIDRRGPASSFPTRSPALAIGNEKNKRRSASNITATMTISSSPNIGGNIHIHGSTSSSSSSSYNNNTKPVCPLPLLRASQSAGTVRRSQSMQAPALDYVVRRKRSTLGFNSSSSTDYDLLGPQTTSPDMATSWLGNK